MSNFEQIINQQYTVLTNDDIRHFRGRFQIHVSNVASHLTNSAYNFTCRKTCAMLLNIWLDEKIKK